MLSLTEELFLLSLREKKHSVDLPYSPAMPYALAGAMLVELVLANRIQLQDGKRVVPLSSEPVESEPLNELLVSISATEKPRKITYWIHHVGIKGKRLEKHLLASLIARGILKVEEKKTLWVIPYTEYAQQDASAKYLRKQHLRDVVFSRQEADPQSVALLSLMKAADLLDHLFTPDEFKAAQTRVEAIIKDEAVGQAVIETLDAISAAAISAALTSMSS
jgi:golgi phosphoprotein 3